MNKINIKSTLQSSGWQDIKEILQEEIGEGQKINSIKTKGKAAEYIARELEAKKEAAKIIARAIKRLETIEKEPLPKDKPSFI